MEKPTPLPTSRGPKSVDNGEQEAGDRTTPEILEAAAKGKPITPEESGTALDWFLSDDPSDDQEVTRKLELNVGTSDAEKLVPWTIRAIDLDTLRRIRRAVTGTRAQRRAGGDIDEVAANLRIVVEGTVDPPLAEAAQRMGIASPESALKIRFRHKPGLIGQIAGEIMSVSGYDEEDVREVQAAKN